ncbi:MAG: protein kinase family protein [Candidatus Cloacimonetes bacterium]|nr:protein kinase family protein [Candidatus Cloacimonadota bacterium]
MSDKTIALADDRTQRMDEKYSHRLVLTQTILETNKDKYEIDLNNRIGMGGESQVYLAKRMSDGEQVVVKIYDTFTDKRKLLTRKKILEFLRENSDYHQTHIMPLLDDGTTEMKDYDTDELDIIDDIPFDVLPYCPEGAIKQCDYQTLKTKIIPEVLQALNLLHTNNLVHRDLKPSNIYFYDNVVVLADFGTTSRIQNIKEHEKTQVKRGTPGYTAPEMSDYYYVIATDYFSFGCTIATLYKGKHVYQNLIDTNDIENINIAMRRKGLPLECSNDENSLQLLVNALVMRDENMRAGYEAVRLWLDDVNSFEYKWRNTINQGFEKLSLNFDFEGIKFSNYQQLADEVSSKWEIGKKYLFRG